MAKMFSTEHHGFQKDRPKLTRRWKQQSKTQIDLLCWKEFKSAADLRNGAAMVCVAWRKRSRRAGIGGDELKVGAQRRVSPCLRPSVGIAAE